MTHLRCDEIFNDQLVTNIITAECNGERILKIGQRLPKLWARIECYVFFVTHGVQYTHIKQETFQHFWHNVTAF